MSRFDKLAAVWDEKSSRVAMARTFGELIAQTLTVPNDAVILDYGCGTGTCALYLSEFASKVIGVDASANMLEQFKNKSKDFNAEFEFICADLQKADVVFPGVDLIVSTMTFHHLKDIKIVIKKFYDSLKLGSFVAIADLDAEDGTFHEDGNDGVEHLGFEREHIINALKEVGFDNISARTAKTIDRNDKNYSIFLITAMKP